MDVAEMPLERLEREITELASHIHAAMCSWLLLVAEFDRREGWGQWGCKSCAHWVSWTCGFALGAAREHVRVARCLSALPLLTDSFSKGELSYSKMRAVTRVADTRERRGSPDALPPWDRGAGRADRPRLPQGRGRGARRGEPRAPGPLPVV